MFLVDSQAADAANAPRRLVYSGSWKPATYSSSNSDRGPVAQSQKVVFWMNKNCFNVHWPLLCVGFAAKKVSYLASIMFGETIIKQNSYKLGEFYISN